MTDRLTEEVITYTCSVCDGVYLAHELDYTDWNEVGCCPRCAGVDHSLSPGTRPAEWWSVGVYQRGREYGGPEEGGWWYDSGPLVEHRRVRVYENFAEAQARVQELYAEIRAEGWLSELAVKGFTERLPVQHTPERRPRYS